MNKIIPWVVIGGTVLLLVIFAGGYFLRTAPKPTQPPVIPVEENNSAPSRASVVPNDSGLVQTTTTSTVRFSDWKLFSDTKHGFQFKYPPFETPRVDSSDASTTYIFFKEFGFDVLQKPKEVTLDEWFRKNVDQNDLLIKSGVFKKINFKGHPALEMTNVEIPSKYLDDAGPISVSLYAESPAKDYILSFEIRSQDSSSGKTIRGLYDTPDVFQRFQDDILSTFMWTQSF